MFGGTFRCDYCGGTGRRVPDDFSIPLQKVDVFTEPGAAPVASIDPSKSMTFVVKEKSSRPTFEALFLDFATALSARSTCRRLQVGCVISSIDHRQVYAIGYNGNAQGGPNDCDRVGAEAVGSCGCFVEGTAVEASDIKAAYRRKYNGLVVQVRTSSGGFTSTPNHPILVLGRGWTAAQDLHDGDKILKVASDNRTFGQKLKDNNRVHFEDVFDACRLTGFSVRRAGTIHDFHDDGGVDEDIDVVTTDCGLGFNFKANTTKPSTDGVFFTTNHALSSCSSHRTLSEPFRLRDSFRPFFISEGSVQVAQRFARTSSSNAGVGQSSFDHNDRNFVPTSEREFGHASNILVDDTWWKDVHSLAFVSVEVLGHLAKNTAFAEALLNCRVGDIESSSNRKNGLTGCITIDNVLNVKRHRFSGHVFNLQTASNWYAVNGGIIAHNCIHSEANAIVNCNVDRSKEKIVYCTHLPCVGCAKLLINVGGVKRVVYRNDYRIRDSLKWFDAASIDHRQAEAD
jgi:deoxycytidylate deaminase